MGKKYLNKIWWKIIGKGNCNLVLIHGWGLNAKIWNEISTKLTSYFTIYLADLPGFGHSYEFGAMSIEEMAEYLLKNAPDKAIWVGWSFGGLVVCQIALMHPERIKALVTVASSPCFKARKGWPGIKLEILNNFQKELNKNFQKTIRRFLTLQALGTETAYRDAHLLNSVVSVSPVPNIEVLNNGLEILKNVDLRKSLSNLFLPHLRIYGYFDNLIPNKISTILDTYWPQSRSLIIKRASHVPFISHSKEFCNAIISLNRHTY